MSTSIGSPGPLPSGTNITVDEFVLYGGETGTASAVLLNAAFIGAEMLVEDEIGSFLSLTVVTGTYQDPTWNDLRLELDYGWVAQVIHTWYSSPTSSHADYTTLATAMPVLLNPRAGIVLLNDCPCPGDHVHVVYQAGLQPGVNKHPLILQALAALATETLKQILRPETADGGLGAASVAAWSSLRYSERRQFLMRTIFGGTPVANMVFRLINRFRSRFGGKM